MDKKSRELVMAKLYFKNKDYKMAENSFTEYLSMNPEDVNALKLSAQVYEQTKRFDKAFEMYERCYLAEPDRTGILLDICRILSMNEIWLEHVDYRKWLNLAIKAFPSNPIVANFKALLSTLPSDDQANQDREPTSNAANVRDDVLAKILERLCSIEEKIDRIEQKVGDLSVSEKVKAAEQQVTPKVQASAQSSILKPAPEPAPPHTSTAVPFLAQATAFTGVPGTLQTQAPALFKTTTLNSNSVPAPSIQPSSNAFSLSTNFFQESMSKLNINSQPSQNRVFGGNLFEQSINKLDLPAWNSTFTFSQPIIQADTKRTVNDDNSEKGAEAEEDGDEVVPNEDLVIENTCNMNPIEIKTGEEDEDTVFEHRCKLFRFKAGEYKERGLGLIKVLKHKTTSKGRLIMRREAVGLVCLNCWDLSKIERPREVQVRFAAVDASDGEPVMNIFLVRFKTKETTDTFMSHLNDLFSENAASNISSSSPVEANKNSERPDVELIDPKLDQSLVDKARALNLPDLFYHKLRNQDSCSGCQGCEQDE